MSLESNSIVMNSNYSQCKSSYESLAMGKNQAEVRLSSFDTCSANTANILSFLSNLNNAYFCEVRNCTSTTYHLGVIRIEDDITIYKSNFVNNKGQILFSCLSSSAVVKAIDCYFQGMRSCDGILQENTNQDWISGVNGIPIVTAEGGTSRRREEMDSCRRLLKVPMSILRFLFISVSTSI